jgi:multicomponent Na+:H+ antiporter subunit G
MTEWLSIILVWSGVGFFVAGTIALLRLPDMFTRLHALTKADNLGLGLLVVGLLWQVDSLLAGFKLLLVWLLVIVASSANSFLIAQHARRTRQEERSWQ